MAAAQVRGARALREPEGWRDLPLDDGTTVRAPESGAAGRGEWLVRGEPLPLP